VPGKTYVYYHGQLVRKDGVFAEYTSFDSRCASIVPEELVKSKEIKTLATEMASLPCAGFTAYQCVCNKLKLPII